MTMPEDTMKMNHDQVNPEDKSEILKMSHDQVTFEETSNNLSNEFSLAQEELKHIEKEACDLQEKWEQTEKEKNQLQIQVDLLQVEKHQLEDLTNEKENSQKLKELKKDLASKVKAQLKLRNEIEKCHLQISEKNDAVEKMKKDNKSLWNMVTLFARKLANADLLTAKEKNIMKKYGEENHIFVNMFDSEDLGQEKDHSLMPENEMNADIKQNKELIKNESTIVQSDNFQFSQSSTSPVKFELSSGANHVMKNCTDVSEERALENVSKDTLKVMREQISAPSEHFPAITPLPPTPPPKVNKFRCDLLKKDLVDSPVMAVPVHKKTSQTSEVSKNQRSLNANNSSVFNSSKKLTFCHQQSEGFDVPSEHIDQRLESNTGNSIQDHASTNYNTHSSLMPYKFSAKRNHNGTIKFNFHITNPVSITVYPNNWEVSCILGQHDIENTETPYAVQPQEEIVDVETSESFSNNLGNSEKDDSTIRKDKKVEPVSPVGLRIPVSESSGQSSFVSVGVSNEFKPNILNHDISTNANSFNYLTKETDFENEQAFDHAHINVNSSKVFDAFVNHRRNNVNREHIEDHADDNISLVSSSCESPSPYKKKKLFSQEFLSPSHKVLNSPISEMKSGKPNNVSNVSKKYSLSAPEVNCKFSNSTDSESELTDKKRLAKRHLIMCDPVKKRRKSSLASVESSNIIPTRNKGRTLLSRASGSSNNAEMQNTNIENADVSIIGKKEKDRNKSSTRVELENEKYLAETHGKVERQINFNFLSCNNNQSNCMILPENFVEGNENTHEQMQQEAILYENVNNKKRISRIKSSSKSKQKIHSVNKSPKKHAKRKRKKELKKMASLKKKAAAWAAQKMKSDVETKEYETEKLFDANFCTSNSEDNCLERNNAENYVCNVPSKNDAQNEEKILNYFEANPEVINNFSNNTAGVSVDFSTKNENNDLSVEMMNSAHLNVPSTALTTYNEIEENFKIIAKESNYLAPDSTACSVSKNDNPELLFLSSEDKDNQNDNEPVLVINQYGISAGTDYSDNQVFQQQINTDISNANNLMEKVEKAEISNSELCEINPSVEINNLPANKMHYSPIQVNNTAHNRTNSMLSPLEKTSIKSPNESPVKTKSSDFPSINNSDVNANFSNAKLPPLPVNPFNESNNQSNAFSPTKPTTGIDEKSFESQISSNFNENGEMSVSSSEDLSKLSLSENVSIAETENDGETEFRILFSKECSEDSFVDFLLNDEDCTIKNISDAETKEKSQSNTKIEESPTSSQSLSDNISSSAAQPFVPISNIYSNVDTIINSVAVGDTTEESKVSSQVHSGFVVSSASSLETSPNVYSNVDMIIDSVAVGGVEIEVETQGLPPRTCKKKHSPAIVNSHQSDKKNLKGSLKSIDLSIAKECALSDSDIMNGHISEADSDSESPLIIAEDFEEVQHSIPVSKSENSEESVTSVNKNSPNKARNRKQRKTPKKIDLPHIEAAFQAIDKARFTETHFKLHVHSLVTILSNPSVLESTPKLVFHLLKYLHTTRKNPMLSFSLSNDPDTLLPISEQCIVKALMEVDAKNKPHLSGLLNYLVETMYQIVLGKVQYHIYGLSSLCRVMTAICKELNDPSKPRRLCCDLLKYVHKFAPFLIASIVAVYREAFEILPNTTEEEKIFLSSLSYGVQQKPKTLTETQWKHCNSIFSKYLTVQFLTHVRETIPYLKNAIEDNCISAFNENEYLLIGPLVIYARVKGWNWAKKYLLEDYVLPNLLAYSNKASGERAFSFFTDLCADICYDCPNKELSRSYLMKYWENPGEREFVQIYAGAALLKLILLRKELFPDEIQKWIPHHHEDPRIVESSNLYFRLRLMEDQELVFQNNVIF